jgi:translation elongation factor aEF-1 beta
MANVTVVAKIFAEDPAELNEIKTRISEAMRLADARIEEIGFGAKILRIMVVVSDKEGGDVEEKLKRIKGVSQVQIEDVSLMA